MIRVLNLVTCSLLCLSFVGYGQSHAPTLGEKPFQSVSEGGIDTVNFENGGLLVHIPLLSLPQLGKLKATFSLTGNGPQYVHSAYCDPGGNCEYGYTHYNPCMEGNTYLGDDGSSSITLEWDQWHTVCGLYHVVLINAPVDSAGQDNPSDSYDAFYDYDDGNWWGAGPSGEMTMEAPVYEQWNEFKIIDADGADHVFGYDPNDYARLKTNDGSGYVLDMGGNRTGLANAMAGPGDTYAIVAPDGTRQTFSRSGLAPSGVMAMTDTNGNQISWNYSIGVTDSIGRQFIYDPYPDASDAPTGCPSLQGQPTADSSKIWSVTDSQGHALISYKLCYTSISIATNFFGEGAGNTFSWCVYDNDSAGDPVSQCYYFDDLAITDEKLQSVILPNNTYWGFGYSQPDSNGVNYGDLTSIRLPSGGELRYTFGNVPACGVITGEEPALLGRVIKSRTVYPIVGAPQTTTYQYTQFLGVGSQESVIETDLAGNETVHELQLLSNGWECKYGDSDTKFYQGSQQSGQLLKEVARSYSLETSPQQPVQNLLVPEPGIITTEKILNSETTTQDGSMVSVDSKGYDNWFYDVQPLLLVSINGGSELTGTSSTISYQYLLSPRQAYIPLNSPTSTSDGIKTTVTNRLATTNPAYAAANLIYLPSSVLAEDNNGNIVAQTNYGYDEAGSPQGTIGNNTSVHALSMKASDPDSVITTTYNSNGMPVSITDARGNAGEPGNHTTFFSYDSTGIFVNQVQKPTTTNGQSHVSYYGTDPTLGVLLWSSDENSSGPQDPGHTTTYSYDLIGRAIGATYPDGGSAQICFSDEVLPNCPSMSAPPFSVQISKQTGSGAEVTVAAYDGVGRVTSNTQAPGTSVQSTVDTVYDQLGNVYSVSNPHGVSASQTDGLTVFTYDALHRKKVQQNPDNITNKHWNYSGLTVSDTDEAGNSWQYISDIAGRLVQVIEPGSLVTNYSYDALGNLRSVAQHGTLGDTPRNRHFTYDALSRLLTSQNPETGTICYGLWSGSSCTSGYDSNGNLLYKTDANGLTTSYTYDALNRVLTKYAPDSDSTHFTYTYDQCFTGWWFPCSNPVGHLVGEGNPDGIGGTIFAYDPMGRVTNTVWWEYAEAGNNWRPGMAVQYDLAGNPTTISYPDGLSLSQNYDAAGRLTTVTDTTPGGPGTPYFSNAQYTPGGALASATYGNGVTENITYNSRLQPCHTTANSPALPQSTIFGNVYDRLSSYAVSITASSPCGAEAGNNGNIAYIADNVNPSWTQSFTYDGLNRLTSAFRSDGAYNHTYNYDSFGNLLVQDNVNSNPSYSIDAATNRLNRINPVTQTSLYAYDAAGNLISSDTSMGTGTSSIGGHTFTYNASNQITAVDNGTTATYLYNGIGERTNKATPSGWMAYIYLNGQPMSENSIINGTGDWTDYIYANGQKIARVTTSIYGGASTTNYYLNDHLGTTQVELDASGNVTWQGQFTPFGTELPDGSTSMHYKFTGKERDAESGLDYFGARYYASNMGRWMSPDWSAKEEPVPYAKLDDPQSLNLYSYVFNNPLSKVDADGHDGCGSGMDSNGFAGCAAFGNHPLDKNDAKVLGGVVALWGGALARGAWALGSTALGFLASNPQIVQRTNEFLQDAASPPGSQSFSSMGQWTSVAESMSGRAAAYEAQITGSSGRAFVVNGVKFDGVNASGLLDAKGPGYEKLLQSSFGSSVADKLLGQAASQLKAANGAPITWSFAEQGAANTVRSLFQKQGIKGINVIYTAPK